MSLHADAVVDRRRLKRRLVVWRTLALLALAAIAVAVAQLATEGDLPGIPGRGYVARIELVGVIVEDADLLNKLDELVDDDRAKALLVYIDSPGGTVVGGEALYAELRKLAERKPVVAVMGTTAASAGYMVALAADRIFARAGSLTGSIGVLFQTAEVTELLRSLGISTTAIKSSPLKAVPSPFEELTPAGREVTERLVEDIHRMFVAMVGERRNLSGVQLAQVSDGRVFTGRQAVEIGLVDAIGGEATARAWLESERGVPGSLPVRDVAPAEEFSMLAQLVSRLFGKTLFPERLTLDGLIAVWHPDLRS